MGDPNDYYKQLNKLEEDFKELNHKYQTALQFESNYQEGYRLADEANLKLKQCEKEKEELEDKYIKELVWETRAKAWKEEYVEQTKEKEELKQIRRNHEIELGSLRQEVIDTKIELSSELERIKTGNREIVRKIIWKIAQDEGGNILHYNEWVDDNWKRLLEGK